MIEKVGSVAILGWGVAGVGLLLWIGYELGRVIFLGVMSLVQRLRGGAR